MRKSLLIGALFCGAVGLLALGHPADVRAQAVFCPTGFVSLNGSCVKFKGPGQAGGAASAFSGAALASQALSELSETTTQETTRTLIKAVSERREREEQRCAEGFSRVGGTCQPNPRPVSQVAAAAPAPEPPRFMSRRGEKQRPPPGAATSQPRPRSCGGIRLRLRS